MYVPEGTWHILCKRSGALFAIRAIVCSRYIKQRDWFICMLSPGASPTILSYNATNSLVRFENKKTL
jgi:hypothetical protein